MNRIAILIIEDEVEVRDALTRDLEPFAETFRIEAAEAIADARSVLAQLEQEGDRLGLALCDHVLPGEKGVDFLVALNQNPQTRSVRKVLITGQAGLNDTIKAVNEADLDHYIAKPWSKEGLHEVVRTELTEYVLREVDELQPYVRILDGPRLLEAISQRAADR